MTGPRKKLIEVALPLDEINAACKADKARAIGTIRNLHKWFAPMPLPAWRAMLYAALIDDPGDDDLRAYHLDLIKRLVANGADLPDESVLEEARENIRAQFPEGVPPVMDPFCGGGSTLVEAQRLGLPTFGSDLNPVPVLITRTLTQLLPKVWGRQPLHPEMQDTPVRRGRRAKTNGQEDQATLSEFTGTPKVYTGYEGIIRDVTYYAEQIRDQAWEQLKDYYPAQPGETPIAWLWARTAKCPNPACRIETILTTSWWLSKRAGDLAWIEPSASDSGVSLKVVAGQSSGAAPEPTKAGRGASFMCVACRSLIPEGSIIRAGTSGNLGLRLTCVVVDEGGKRSYRDPRPGEEAVALNCPEVMDFVEVRLPDIPRWFSGPRFGLVTQSDLYTRRQLLTLSTFADLVASIRQRVVKDGGSTAWADTVTTILGLSVGKMAGSNSSQTRWFISGRGGGGMVLPAFGRNDVPMNWDFGESSAFADGPGNWVRMVSLSMAGLPYVVPAADGTVERADARHARTSRPALIATDPPYFDAIGYADLSDYFYVWHRRALRAVHPDLYSTMAAPRGGELTAVAAHHGDSKESARDYFIDGFTDVFGSLQESLHPDLPLCVVYASKERKASGEEETRWSSILTSMVNAGLEITGTWPIHGTGENRLIGLGTNAVATYVAMVSRHRSQSAGTCSLSDFNRALRRELKTAVHSLQAAGILPVDLAQAAMGPGMQVYSRHRAVLDQRGERVPVGHALRLINQALAEVLDEQEGELDPESRFAVTWWGKHHWDEAPFGEADQLARPYGIAVDDVIRAGVATYPRPGFVKVAGDAGLDREWSPVKDACPTAWEAVHHLADRLIDGGGTADAGALMAELGARRDQAQGLVYRLHAIAARKGWTKDQERYNLLIGSWSDLLNVAGRADSARVSRDDDEAGVLF